MDNCKDLRAIANKQKQKKKKNIRNHEKSNKELNALVEKKSQKFVKNKKRRKTEKELQHFQEMQISDDKSKKSVSSFAESVKGGEISAPALNEKQAWTNYLLHIKIMIVKINQKYQLKITWILFLLILV